MNKITDRLLIMVGILCLVYTGILFRERYIPRQNTVHAANGNALQPLRITIPSLSLDLPVYQAKIDDKSWEVSNNGVSHVATSPVPGSTGNSIMYGHNWPNLLGKLRTIKPGDQINVILSDGKVARYSVYFVTVVTPDQTHIYTNTADARLTLYTCTGFLDTKRLVVTAILEQ